jgi:hypothetical protein
VPTGPVVGTGGVILDLEPNVFYTISATDGTCVSLASTFVVLAQRGSNDKVIRSKHAGEHVAKHARGAKK